MSSIEEFTYEDQHGNIRDQTGAVIGWADLLGMSDYYAAVPPVGAGEQLPERDEPPGEGRDSWVPIDLGPYLRGEIRPVEPSIGVIRTDGLRLLYPGKEHAVIGEMEAGKSWFAWPA